MPTFFSPASFCFAKWDSFIIWNYLIFEVVKLCRMIKYSNNYSQWTSKTFFQEYPSLNLQESKVLKCFDWFSVISNNVNLGGVPFSLAQLIANENERLESTNLENANLTQNGTERLGQTTKRPPSRHTKLHAFTTYTKKRTSEKGKLDITNFTYHTSWSWSRKVKESDRDISLFLP